MKMKKIFYEMSIRHQIKVLVFVILTLFVVLCGLISAETRELIYKNEDEHMQITALRLRDRGYEKKSVN